MNLGMLFLRSISSGIITNEEMFWIASHQKNFTRIEEATALKLGRLLDKGIIQMASRLEN